MTTAAAEPPVVLIADDEAPIAALVAALVAELGGEPLTAPNGLQALVLARSRRPALLVTDLMMPRLDGAALIRQLRADAASAGATAPAMILMTASLAHLDAAGADAVLPKPFDLDQLEALLRRFLDADEPSARGGASG